MPNADTIDMLFAAVNLSNTSDDQSVGSFNVISEFFSNLESCTEVSYSPNLGSITMSMS